MNSCRMVVLLIISALPNSAWAGIRDDILSDAARCAQVTDDRQWLDCYYGAAQPMRSRLGLPAAPEAQQNLSADAAGKGTDLATQKSKGIFFTLFGNDNDQAGPDQFGRPPIIMTKTIDHLEARMVAFTFDGNGIFIATLSSGQIWRQLPGDTTRAQWSRLPHDFVYNVSITRGMLGSYNFRIAGLPGSFKVKRMR